MTKRYSGTFTLDSWDQTDAEPEGPLRRSRAVLTKTFAGDLVGTSRTEILMARLDDDGPASYCGFEHISGTVAGRTGSFVLRHAASGGPMEDPWMTWQVLTGSGRAELTGIHGEGEITRHEDGSHTYWLELGFEAES